MKRATVTEMEMGGVDPRSIGIRWVEIWEVWIGSQTLNMVYRREEQKLTS